MVLVVVVFISGKSVIAVDARCTDVYTCKRIMSGQGMLCTVRGIVLIYNGTSHVFVLGSGYKVDQRMSIAL